MTVLGIRHTGIVVSDMTRSLEFYRDLLGMEVWADFKDQSRYIQTLTDLPGANIWLVKLKSQDGSSIELLQYLSHPQEVPEPRRACDVGCNHVALRVDNIDSLYERLKRHGICFNAPPTVSGDGGAKVAYSRDHEGALVELVELIPRDN